MLSLVLALLVILWVLGYLSIPGLAIPPAHLFTFNARAITLWDILMFLLIIWVVGLLPSPLQEVAGIILLFWLLSTIGILAIPGLTHILIIAIIVAVIVSLLRPVA